MRTNNGTGKGSFKKLEENLGHILEASKSKEVRMTIASQTSKHMAKSVKFLADIGFESICAFYSAESHWSDNELKGHNERAYELTEYYIGEIEKNLTQKINTLENNLCGAGRNYLGIGVDGVIYPCHRFTSMFGFKGAFPIGDIFNGIDEAKRMPFVRMKKKLMMGCDFECGECALEKKCGGGCMAANYQTTGYIGMRPPAARFHEIIWNEISKSIIEYFKENENENFDKRFLKKKEKEKAAAC